MRPDDPAREEQQIARLRALAQEAGLDPVFAEKFLTFVIAEVIRHHLPRPQVATPADANAVAAYLAGLR